MFLKTTGSKKTIRTVGSLIREMNAKQKIKYWGTRHGNKYQLIKEKL